MKRKRTKSSQQSANDSGSKIAITIRLDSALISKLDEMAEQRGSSRPQVMTQAVEFYTWMMQGGFAVQHFQPWKDSSLKAEAINQPKAKRGHLVGEGTTVQPSTRAGMNGSYASSSTPGGTPDQGGRDVETSQ